VCSSDLVKWKEFSKIRLQQGIEKSRPRKYKTIKCKICDKIFKTDMKYGNKKYCSINCRNIGFRQQNNPNAKISDNEILFLLKEIHSTKELAKKLNVAKGTIGYHLKDLLKKNQIKGYKIKGKWTQFGTTKYYINE
jgi:DNA-binding CsgD family transcriptional regulator